jgi:hypothetical protein
MHAAVRYMLQNDREQPWPAELGVPINQEDLAGTLMAFVWGTLDGLEKLGVHPPAPAREEYLAAWRFVGRLMGLDPALIPGTVADAERLKQRIEDRQIAPSEEGRLLTRVLLDMMERNSEGAPLKAMPAILMRHFLPEHVADFLGVPKHAFEKLAIEALELLAKGEDLLMRDSPVLQRAARSFSVHFIRWMISVELGGRAAPFSIPLELERRWNLHGAPEPTFLQRLAAWFRRGWHRLFG